MNINRDYKNRQIIPRLYPYKYAFYLGEIKPKIRHDLNIKPSKEYLKKEKKWLFNKSLPYAIEFVGEALILNDYNNKNSVEAAKFILKKQKYISNITKQLANEFLKNPNEIPSFNLFDIDIYKEISLLKKNIRAYSINAINWINIALYYAILGQIEKANHAIRVALNLSPYNRFILRSAARFFLHKGDSEKALSILRNTEYTKYDPWLLASEISVSQVNDTRSSNIKIARNILDHLDVSPKDLSELFGSMGTLEINSGNAKKRNYLKKL